MGGRLAEHDRLAAALERAGDNPGLLPEFYRLLIESPLLLPVPVTAAATLDRDGTLAMVRWRNPRNGDLFIPLFSGPRAVPDSIPAHVRLMQLAARDLFTHVTGVHFRLNPASLTWADLPPDVIATLLRDGTVHSGVTVETLPSGSLAQIGPPSEPQATFVQALRSLFEPFPMVPQVYLFEFLRKGPTGPNNRLTVGIVAAHDMAVAHDISALLPASYTGSLGVNVMFLQPGDPIVQGLTAAGILPVVERRNVPPL